MCTAILNGCYAGRNLDIEKSYGESLIITPRNYVLPFRQREDIGSHIAFIGIGTVRCGYPLYYDAANEYGLYIAGLNYVGNAKYLAPDSSKINLAPYELIPYILSTCKSVKEAKEALRNINITDIPFNRELPSAELHFFIADKEGSITVEPDKDGINVYANEVGVLSNNPPFPLQMHNLNNYANLSNEQVTNRFCDSLPLKEYSRGMGAIGLPGDLSSQSRFVRAAFHKANSVESGDPCDIFHLLSSVAMPHGSVKLGDEYERTEYSSAVNMSSITYYYKTYKSNALCSAKLFNAELDAVSLDEFPLLTVKDVYSHN